MSDMITIAKSDIPAYLHTSSFYLSLDQEDDDQIISVPQLCMKRDLCINSPNDFNCLLHTMRYWMLDFTPDELVAYMFQHDPQMYKEVILEFEPAFPVLKAIGDIIKSPWKYRLQKAIEYGELSIVKYLCEHGYPLSHDSCETAACVGSLECLQYLHERGCPWDFFTCYAAAVYGHLRCLKYAVENGCSVNLEPGLSRSPIQNALNSRADGRCAYLVNQEFGVIAGATWSQLNCWQRRRFDEPEILQSLHQGGYVEVLPSINDLAQNGLLNCLKYAHEQGWGWNQDTCAAAAGGGHLACLEYLHEHHCPWDSNTTAAAAKRGSLECLQYAYTHGCPVPTDICTDCVIGGNLECLMYAHERGGHITAETAVKAATSSHFSCFRYAYEHGGRSAVLAATQPESQFVTLWFDTLHALICAHEKGDFVWDSTVYTDALEHNNWFCFDYALENGCPIPTTTEFCNEAASSGKLKILRSALQGGFPCDASVCAETAGAGQMECLEYLHDAGCPWDERTCTKAAHNGHLSCLKFAHEHGCPWGEEIFHLTVRYKIMNPRAQICLDYARTHGCPGGEVDAVIPLGWCLIMLGLSLWVAVAE